MDYKLPERRFSLSMSRRLGGYAHVGDVVPPTQYMHFHTKFQQHNIAPKATLASLSHIIDNSTKRINHQLNLINDLCSNCTYVEYNAKSA